MNFDHMNQLSPARFAVVPQGEWSQGFATYGGYVAAAALHAVRLAGQNRPALSAQVNFLAPAPVTGFEIEVAVLRAGKGTAVVEAQVYGADKTGAQTLAAKILFTLGHPRGASIGVTQALEPSQLIELQTMRDARPDTPAIKGVVPGFMENFQFRPLVNAVPFSGTLAQEHALAIRPRCTLSMPRDEALLLISDINPPAMLTLVDEPCPASTAAWMLTFEHPLTLADGGAASLQDWFYVLIHLDTAGAGYGNHSTAIFDAAGTQVTSNRQMTTVFERDGGQKPLRTLPRRLAFKAGYSLVRLGFKLIGRFTRH